MSTPPHGAGSTFRRPHILILTSDEGLKDFLGEGLVLGGFWISAIASAIQALEVFRLRTFDLVLLDAALGGIGALELVRRLRGRSDRSAGETPRTDIPILLVAASLDEVDASAAAQNGADGVLTAPLELNDLVAHLHRVINAWRAEHPGRPYADELAQANGPSDLAT